MGEGKPLCSGENIYRREIVKMELDLIIEVSMDKLAEEIGNMSNATITDFFCLVMEYQSKGDADVIWEGMKKVMEYD